LRVSETSAPKFIIASNVFKSILRLIVEYFIG